MELYELFRPWPNVSYSAWITIDLIFVILFPIRQSVLADYRPMK